ncbi:hypothetical protein KKC32_00765 [Patescibacteria group bacterium]|nr:hypothetical protein [Patescibacteria group bacterium]
MYYYIYDTFLDEKKYEKIIDKLKTRLLDLDIQGKHEKLTLLKNVEELIGDEVKRGTTTVVVVGNDKTFLKVINVVAKNNVTLGIIPIGEGNDLARYLGVPEGESACDILAARKIIKFDLGKINSYYFFTNMKINKNLPRMSIEKDEYKIIPGVTCYEVEICNFYYPRKDEIPDKAYKKCSVRDRKLELFIKTKVKAKGWLHDKVVGMKIDSVFQGDKFDIKSFEYLPVVLDDYKIMKTPVIVEVEPEKLNVIVGKERADTII